MYTEISVIVEGALEETETFTDYALEREYLVSLAREAAADGVVMEIYRLTHEHAPDVDDCMCVQFLMSHAPAYRFPEDVSYFLEDDDA